MNLGEMRQRAKRRYRDLENVFVLDTTWNDHLNAAYHEFYQAARWPFKITSVDKTLAAGERFIALTSAELEFLDDIYDVTGKKVLQPVPDENSREWNMRMRLHFMGQNSQPLFYQIVGKNVFILPAPAGVSPTDDHTIRVFYYSQDPGRMTLDIDSPDMPIRYHEALVSHAVAKAHLDDGNVEQNQAFRKEFENVLQQAYTELRPRGVMHTEWAFQDARLEALRGGRGDRRRRDEDE